MDFQEIAGLPALCLYNVASSEVLRHYQDQEISGQGHYHQHPLPSFLPLHFQLPEISAICQ